MAIKIKSRNKKAFDLVPWLLDAQHVQSFISLDTETTGLDAYRGDLPFAWSTCTEDGGTTVSRYDTDKNSRQRLQALLDDTTIGKVSHNAHFDMNMLISDGYTIPAGTVWHCSKLICNVLYNLEPSYELDDLAFKYGGYPKDEDLHIKKAAKIYKSYDKIPKYLMDKYQDADAERCMLLFLTFWPKIQENPETLEQYMVEIALVHTTMRFERRGMMIYRKKAEKLIKWMKEKLQINERRKEKILPSPVNFHSPKQLTELLYNQLGLPELKRNKSDTGPSTDKETIELLNNYVEDNPGTVNSRSAAVLDSILQERAYTKGKAMVEAYLECCDENDILNPHLNTHQAKTGRESSENPNLQNVQKSAALRTRYPIPARECFRARPGYFLLLKDYGSIEMRIATQLTGSKRLIKLLGEDFDFHSACAEAFYNDIYTNPEQTFDFYISKNIQKHKKEYLDLAKKIGKTEAEEQIAKKAKGILRSAAKNARFAMLYGAGIRQTASTLMLPLNQVKEGYERDKEAFPEFHELMRNCMHEVRVQGYVETIFKRKLHVSRKAIYAATDYKVQGSAGELFKRSQIRVDSYLRSTWFDYDISIWMVVHDELILEIPRTLLSNLHTIITDIDYLMTEYKEITVPLEVGNKLSFLAWTDAYDVDAYGKKI